MDHDIVVMRLCVKQYLEHLREMDESRMALEEEMTRLRSSITLGAVRYSEAPTGCDGDRVAEGVAHLTELQQRWSETALEAYSAIGDARCFCYETLDRRMCWMHWVEGTTWVRIAMRMHYDRKTVMRRSDNGVREIYAWMPEEWRRTLPDAQPWD